MQTKIVELIYFLRIEPVLRMEVSIWEVSAY
jgi:hypothetical protein